MTDLHPTDTTASSSAVSSAVSSAAVEWHAVDADDRWPGRAGGPRTPPASTRTAGPT